MTQEKILEGNRLIAKFMGWVDSPYENLPNKMYSEDLSYGKPLDQFNYHTSLDELMPVVEKIPTLKFKYGRFHVRIVMMSVETYCRIESKSKAFRTSAYGKRPLAEVIFITVVQFIEWYNQNEVSKASKPCPNCNETEQPCACMRNICRKCGKPVGNITFTICDKCWDIEFPPKK